MTDIDDQEIPPPEERFKNNLLDLVDLIYDLVADAADRGYNIIDPRLINICGTLLQGYNVFTLINNFIKKSHTHWDQIHDREEVFFIDHATDIFGELPLKNVNAFRLLIEAKDKNGNPVISQEDRDAVWDFLGSLVKISIQYIHQIRGPTVIDGKAEYSVHNFEYIDLDHHANKWEVIRKFESD